jgi:hypothetical protein
MKDLGNQKYFGQKAVAVKLRAGRNRLMLKSNNTMSTDWGMWCFACRVVLADGRVVTPEVTG